MTSKKLQDSTCIRPCKVCQCSDAIRQWIDLSAAGAKIYKCCGDLLSPKPCSFIVVDENYGDEKNKKVIAELEKVKIQCPRCKFIKDNAKQALMDYDYSKKMRVISICAHCKKLKMKSYCPCLKMLKNFMDAQTDEFFKQEENVKKDKKPKAKQNKLDKTKKNNQDQKIQDKLIASDAKKKHQIKHGRLNFVKHEQDSQITTSNTDIDSDQQQKGNYGKQPEYNQNKSKSNKQKNEQVNESKNKRTKKKLETIGSFDSVKQDSLGKISEPNQEELVKSGLVEHESENKSIKPKKKQEFIDSSDSLEQDRQEQKSKKNQGKLVKSGLVEQKNENEGRQPDAILNKKYSIDIALEKKTLENQQHIENEGRQPNARPNQNYMHKDLENQGKTKQQTNQDNLSASDSKQEDKFSKSKENNEKRETIDSFHSVKQEQGSESKDSELNQKKFVKSNLIQQEKGNAGNEPNATRNENDIKKKSENSLKLIGIKSKQHQDQLLDIHLVEQGHDTEDKLIWAEKIAIYITENYNFVQKREIKDGQHTNKDVTNCNMKKAEELSRKSENLKDEFDIDLFSIENQKKKERKKNDLGNLKKKLKIHEDMYRSDQSILIDDDFFLQSFEDTIKKEDSIETYIIPKEQSNVNLYDELNKQIQYFLEEIHKKKNQKNISLENQSKKKEIYIDKLDPVDFIQTKEIKKHWPLLTGNDSNYQVPDNQDKNIVQSRLRKFDSDYSVENLTYNNFSKSNQNQKKNNDKERTVITYFGLKREDQNGKMPKQHQNKINEDNIVNNTELRQNLKKETFMQRQLGNISVNDGESKQDTGKYEDKVSASNKFTFDVSKGKNEENKINKRNKSKKEVTDKQNDVIENKPIRNDIPRRNKKVHQFGYTYTNENYKTQRDVKNKPNKNESHKSHKSGLSPDTNKTWKSYQAEKGKKTTNLIVNKKYFNHKMSKARSQKLNFLVYPSKKWHCTIPKYDSSGQEITFIKKNHFKPYIMARRKTFRQKLDKKIVAKSNSDITKLAVRKRYEGKIIHGNKTVETNISKLLKTKPKEKHDTPSLFSEKFDYGPELEDKLNVERPEIIHKEKLKSVKKKTSKSNESIQKPASRVVHYRLSDPKYIDNGWTLLPTVKIVRKLNVYRMHPAHPQFDWFKKKKNKSIFHHKTGELFADFDDNGHGRLYYKNGNLALSYYDAEELHAKQRYVVYSRGEPDKANRARPPTVLAMFDFLGNGVVYDEAGNVRIKYNQTEGAVIDPKIGPVSHWQWHGLNDSPAMQQVMVSKTYSGVLNLGIESKKLHNIQRNADDKQMLAIEFEKSMSERNQKLNQEFRPFPIKTKALKINENFSLRILDQATIHLDFTEGSTKMKTNLGMLLDKSNILDTNTAEMNQYAQVGLDRFPPLSGSVEVLQLNLKQAEQREAQYTKSELKSRVLIPELSIDKMMKGVAKPHETCKQVCSSLEVDCCKCMNQQ